MTVFRIVPMSLDEACRKVYYMLCLRQPEGVKLLYESAGSDVVVRGDMGRVTQVIYNIVGNAFKFTTIGSVSYGFTSKGDEVEVYIRDTGAGIPQEKLPQIFDRFVKANENVQGTGLGLSISKTIVEKLGGRIWVTSEVGKGTEFRFTLPLSDEKVVPASTMLL